MLKYSVSNYNIFNFFSKFGQNIHQMSRVSSKTGSYGDDGGSLVSAALLILKMMLVITLLLLEARLKQ